MASRILIVDDEADIVDLIQYNLEQAGYEVRTADDGESALRSVAEARPALVLLDLMLPDLSGMEVCRRLRKDPATEAIPIVMITARGDEIDRVVGFELGADDYVVKPFSPRELVLRVQAVLRRATAPSSEAPPAADGPITVDALTIDRARHEVRVDGEPVELTALEFRLLSDLATRRGEVQSRDALLERVWGYAPGTETRTVDTHVKRLREKLKAGREVIETVRGVGYRMR